LEIEVSIVENMASGIMLLPKHRQLDWQNEALPVRISFDRIKKNLE
jgi:hypothetical protein